MLNYVHLENFRAFGRPTTIPLAPITLLFGENSAGKTSILHALSLLKQSADADDPDTALLVRDPRGILDLGSFEELIFDHDVDRVLRIGIGWRARAPEVASKRTSATSYRRPVDLQSGSSYGKEWAFRLNGKEGIVWDSVAMTDGVTADPLVRLRAMSRDEPITTDEGVVSVQPQTMPGVQRFQAPKSGFPQLEVDAVRKVLCAHAEVLSEIHESGRKSQPEFSASISGHSGGAFSDISGVLALAREGGLTDARLLTFLGFIWHDSYGGSGWSQSRFSRGPWMGFDFINLLLYRTQMSSPPPAWREAIKAVRRCRLLNPSGTVESCEMAVRTGLNCYTPIGPFRQPPARLYTHSGVNPRGVGRSGELVADMLHSDPAALKRTNHWLSAFGVQYQLKLRPLGARRSDVFEVRLIDKKRSGRLDIAFTDVGFGISQLLPIVVQCVGTKDRVISIEQPEVHIHPRLQAEIGDLLVDCVAQNGHQFLIETHSEHLILRLRRLVREGKLKPSDISVIYVGRGREGSTAQRIGIKSDGSFDREWPGGFFPERINELL